MGRLFRDKGHDFWVYWSKDLQERMHVHVYRGDKKAVKVWLEPTVKAAMARGYTRKQIEQVEAIVRDHREQVVEEWRRRRGSSRKPSQERSRARKER